MLIVLIPSFFVKKKGGGVVYIFLLLKFVEPGGPEPRVQAQGQAAKPTSKRNKKKKSKCTRKYNEGA